MHVGREGVFLGFSGRQACTCVSCNLHQPNNVLAAGRGRGGERTRVLACVCVHRSLARARSKSTEFQETPSPPPFFFLLRLTASSSSNCLSVSRFPSLIFLVSREQVKWETERMKELAVVCDVCVCVRKRSVSFCPIRKVAKAWKREKNLTHLSARKLWLQNRKLHEDRSGNEGEGHKPSCFTEMPHNRGS